MKELTLKRLSMFKESVRKELKELIRKAREVTGDRSIAYDLEESPAVEEFKARLIKRIEEAEKAGDK